MRTYRVTLNQDYMAKVQIDSRILIECNVCLFVNFFICLVTIYTTPKSFKLLQVYSISG